MINEEPVYIPISRALAHDIYHMHAKINATIDIKNDNLSNCICPPYFAYTIRKVTFEPPCNNQNVMQTTKFERQTELFVTRNKKG